MFIRLGENESVWYMLSNHLRTSIEPAHENLDSAKDQENVFCFAAYGYWCIRLVLCLMLTDTGPPLGRAARRIYPRHTRRGRGIYSTRAPRVERARLSSALACYQLVERR